METWRKVPHVERCLTCLDSHTRSSCSGNTAFNMSGFNIAAARAVDREFEYKLWLTFGGGRRGGCAPRTPLLSGGLRPQDPPKGAPRPWLQRLVDFSRTIDLSGAAALPGADCFLKNLSLFLKKPLVQGSCAACGRTFSRIPTFC